jgi:hypothetical protein
VSQELPREMSKRFATVCFILAALNACATTQNIPDSGHNAASRDVEEYAIASCLFYQQQPFLKDQGDGWASAIIQRSKGGLDAFTAVADAVKMEISKGNMVVIRAENEPGHEKALPIAYCFGLLTTASVELAVEKATKQIESSYRK